MGSQLPLDVTYGDDLAFGQHALPMEILYFPGLFSLAISIAQQQIEQLRSAQFTDPVLNVTAGTVLVPDTVSNGRTYRVTRTVVGSNNDTGGNPTLKTITVRVDPTSPGWAGLPVILMTSRSTTSKGTN
jgi:hypothetical protein